MMKCNATPFSRVCLTCVALLICSAQVQAQRADSNAKQASSPLQSGMIDTMVIQRTATAESPYPEAQKEVYLRKMDAAIAQLTVVEQQRQQGLLGPGPALQKEADIMNSVNRAAHGIFRDGGELLVGLTINIRNQIYLLEDHNYSPDRDLGSLNLTEDQAEQLRTILLDHRGKVRQRMKSLPPGLNEDQLRGALYQIAKATRMGIASVLTPKQLIVWDAKRQTIADVSVHH
jgi:hypothetical protein